MATAALVTAYLGGFSTRRKTRERLGITWKFPDKLMLRKEKGPISKITRQATVLCSTSQSSPVATDLSDKQIIVQQARKRFCEEVAFCKQDLDISLAKAMLLVSAEDEAFISVNSEKDRLAAQKEGRVPPKASMEMADRGLDALPLAGNTISAWLTRFDVLSNEVATLLATKGVHNHPIHVLRAVNTVLFELRGFNRTLIAVDSTSLYLHLVMTVGSGTAVMLGIIYMELCRRLGIKMTGTAVDQDFYIWPLLENLQDIFEPFEGGRSWFSEVNDTASQLNSYKNGIKGFAGSVAALQAASNREIIGIALSNLKNLYWKQACRAYPGLALTDPLYSPLYLNGSLIKHPGLAVGALMRPQDLRLATMASERLLILQPHNWACRKDHGLLLYHSRRYGEAVQELSICMALAPIEEAQLLEHFVEKLHLMRVESSWNTLKPSNTHSRLV